MFNTDKDFTITRTDSGYRIEFDNESSHERKTSVAEDVVVYGTATITIVWMILFALTL